MSFYKKKFKASTKNTLLLKRKFFNPNEKSLNSPWYKLIYFHKTFKILKRPRKLTQDFIKKLQFNLKINSVSIIKTKDVIKIRYSDFHIYREHFCFIWLL